MKPVLYILACALLVGSLRSQNTEAEDRFIAGYAAAVLEREFSLKPVGLVVQNGEISYPDWGFGRIEREQVVKSLRAIPGVKGVTIVSAEAGEEPGRQRLAVPPNGTSLTAFLSPGRLFDPLLADPRWPHFYAAYNFYSDYADEGQADQEVERVASTGLGETLAFIGKSYSDGFRWQAGLQAGVFSIFDLDTRSYDLVNTDFFLGPYASFRYEDWSLLTRLYHQSSHLGDEYLLRPGISGSARENLSYEAVDAVLSYELSCGLRAYAGAGYLINTSPSGIKRWSAQYGAEWYAPFTFGATDGIRPVIAADLQHREQENWDMDYSVRAGLQFEDPGRAGSRLLLMLEYYDGSSPNGQFYTDRIEYMGLGLHFYF